ncbi:hypothetical protein [Caulobacter sp. RHG1]|uniref:hypothetical protein n=1 Tax=Caulobacter sp. (strain RHG1) TaxID=2545762 RepID=UPI0015551865|nr:hypothetical protein [Caulobacter sp. RHG1]NQE64243.1 hypothetical protein [Caulobacter sp. RHG1]
MSRAWSAVAVAALMLAACGREGEKASTAPVEVNGQQTNLRELEKVSAHAEKAAVKGTSALAPAGLPNLLPASVGHHQRVDVRSEAGPEPGMTTAIGHYAKGAQVFELRVTDLGAIGSVGAEPSAVGAVSERKTATGYEKVSTAAGRTITEQWDQTARKGRYSMVAADRFAISADGAVDDVDVLKVAVETVNGARLKALAPAG